MKIQVAMDVAKWLLSFNHIITAVPVAVRIGLRKYAGARITEDQGTSVVKLYLLGELPSLYRRSHPTSFWTADSEQEWCLTAWFRRIAANDEYDEIHPFGNHILLTLWSELESWAANQCEPTRCRLKMTITEVGPILSNIKQSTEEKPD
jgi:hypothetical protein